MTTIPDDIRAIAVRLCGCWGPTFGWGELEDAIAHALEAERERATVAERERSAKLAESYNLPDFSATFPTSEVVNWTAIEIAAAIRSQTP